MIRKCLAVVVISMLLGRSSFAEPQRAFFVKENRMPEASKTEVGVVSRYVEVPDDYAADGNGSDYFSAAPTVRYGLTDKLAVYGEIPYAQVAPSEGDTERGLGDVVAGAEMTIFEDLFGYPFIVPHVEMSLDTGDEDKGLGYGKSLFTAGASVGTVVLDMFHYIVDVSYTFNERANDGSDDDKNVASVGGAFIWDLNEEFSLIAEARSDNNKDEDGHVPLYVEGGFSYKATENLNFSLLGGGAKNTDADVIASGKITYSF